MNIIIQDQLYVNMVKCAFCKNCNKHIDNMNECPQYGTPYCDPDCVDYEENYNENEVGKDND